MGQGRVVQVDNPTASWEGTGQERVRWDGTGQDRVRWDGTGQDRGWVRPAGGSERRGASQVAYDTGDYYHSITWLEEAVNLFRLSYGNWNTEDLASLEDALDHLAFSYFMAGNISHALTLSREFLRYVQEEPPLQNEVGQQDRHGHDLRE
nr:PREDICTED: prolyl 4-hydroxylase subunit alpha-3 [Struthio camelus australis]